MALVKIEFFFLEGHTPLSVFCPSSEIWYNTSLVIKVGHDGFFALQRIVKNSKMNRSVLRFYFSNTKFSLRKSFVTGGIKRKTEDRAAASAQESVLETHSHLLNGHRASSSISTSVLADPIYSLSLVSQVHSHLHLLTRCRSRALQTGSGVVMDHSLRNAALKGVCVCVWPGEAVYPE